ncbi:MAG TPA: molybdopterin cofactor-binding domain-containing protein, partial [Vicinamibacterales bacterium]|nr:molybdopterin cofactor-binding domain-containing protein [Vicinamibacterales bacterium]
MADQQQQPAAAAPAQPTARWPPPPERVHLGRPIRRLDGPGKAQGAAKYTYDIIRPGMLYGRLLDSPHPHARVRSIDVSAAEKLPGVRAVLVLKDPANPDTARVRYQGEEVAAVAADTEEIAGDAIRLIKVDYEVLPHLATVEQAMRPEAPVVFEKGNVTEPSLNQDGGDVEAALQASTHVVEGFYTTQVQTHTSLETHGGICEWNGENLTAWVSTQAVHGTRDGTARALNIPQANVRVITDYMGGGFGSKLGGDVQVVICARLAKMANRPVKLMLDRKEEHLVTGNRPSAYAKVRAGVDANGKLTAIDSETWGTGGAGQGARFPMPYQVYVFPVRRQRHRDVYINAGPQRAMRAPGHPQSCFVTEIVVDELADRLRMDPL